MKKEIQNYEKRCFTHNCKKYNSSRWSGVYNIPEKVYELNLIKKEEVNEYNDILCPSCFSRICNEVKKIE